MSEADSPSSPASNWSTVCNCSPGLARSRAASAWRSSSATASSRLRDSRTASACSRTSALIQLFISRRTVESHVSSVFAKLGIVESPESSRRVLAVLAYLQG